MFLLPQPKSIEMKSGIFFLEKNCSIVLDAACSFEDLDSARLLQSEIHKITGFLVPISKEFIDEKKNNIYLKKCHSEMESYEVIIDESYIEISGADAAGLFYGVQTLRQIVRQRGVQIPALIIKDSPYFKNRGFYHDVTRGKVPTLATLKELVDRASFYKINHLQLYVEHTFAFKNLSEVWMDKDPLTAEEILELDEYCKKRHVELVPSLSTFGHLYEILNSKSYLQLCELDGWEDKPYSWVHRMQHHTLDVSSQKSFELVEAMLGEFVPLFTSDKFNICCDETFDLGKGKNKTMAQQIGNGRLYTEFLNKVISATKRYGKKVMFWGDIILKHPELLQEIPKDVTCLNWAYFASVTEDGTKTIAESGLPQYVCPGVTGWNRLMNEMDNSFINIQRMVEFGKKYGAVGVLNTDWGDFGHVNLFANSMPGMIHGAALSWNPDGEKDIATVDRAISILEFGNNGFNIMNLLRELSRQQKAHWAHIVFWKEREILEPEFINPWIEKLTQIDHNIVYNSYHRSIEISKELAKESVNIFVDRKLDMEEFIISAKGVALINAAFLVIKRHSLGDKDVELAVEPSILARELEYWAVDYSSVWRKRNKESELGKIREVIIYLSHFLRSVK